uniref:Methionine synthase reductase n=1 Tax=Xiphophorus couchianus TaxID=32473 RepID=A0A3B5LE30_9TELE
ARRPSARQAARFAAEGALFFSGFPSMPLEVKPRFVVLYGSQKGQAQSIAEGIAEEAEEHGLVADLCCLNQNDKYNLEKERAPVVFVVSTTGDGEPPDNALQFVKRIKKRTLSPDHYKHLLYALLALGDTNYANFCNCGKTIERRLRELGAKQFYPTGYADDGVGLELVIDPWLKGLWNSIKDTLSKMASDRTVQLKEDSAKEIPESSLPDVQLNLLSIADKQICEPDSKYSSSLAISDVRPASASTVSSSAPKTQACSEGVPQVSLAASLTSSLPPLSESSLNVPALPPPYLDVALQEADAVEQAVERLSKETCNEVPISKAVQLSKGDSVKTALLLELDISVSAFPSMTYHPGDSFDVFCPNVAEEVDHLLHRLGLQDQKNHRVQISLKHNTKKRGAQVPPHIPENVSLLFLLTWCLEIRSVPKKAFLRALVEHTSDSAQKRRLQELCSKQGAADYNLYVRDPSLSVSELLTAFPSYNKMIDIFACLSELLPKLQPRPYSAASSHLRHPEKLRFVFNVVEFPACSGRPTGRRGLCTGWLFDLVNPGLVFPEKAELALPKIHVSLRPSYSFRPPSDPSLPFIMIGPGTGVAPFIGFLQQREEEKKENPEAKFGETWLFFGCRYRNKDYLFREELENFVSSGTLNHLKVCFSREDRKNEEEPPSAAQPRYVQHNLLLCCRQVTDILLRQDGYIYVCGDAKNMAKDVNETLVEMIKTELQVDQLEAMKMLAGLREQKRYLQDIWA